MKQLSWICTAGFGLALLMGCPTPKTGGDVQPNLPNDNLGDTFDAGSVTLPFSGDAGSISSMAFDDAGQTNIPPAVDSGSAQNSDTSVSMESVCVEMEEPDAGFGEATGWVDAVADGSRVAVTITLFDVNCGITHFSFAMQEQDSNETLHITVSPVGLTEDTPLTRCYCDMALSADYFDDDNSLERIEAYFFNDVILPNPQAITPNGLIGVTTLD